MENRSLSTRFVKGDPRCWRGGRPKTFNAVRKLVQQISNEEVTDKNGEKMRRIEKIMRSWATSQSPILQLSFIQYGFGKPPEKVEVEGAGLQNVIVRFAASMREQSPELPDENHTPGTPRLTSPSAEIDR